MNLKVWAKTDTGLKRETNQDSHLVNEKLGLFIIADGMGGHNGGEIASHMAIWTAEEIASRAQAQHPHDLIEYLYSEASRRIYDRSLNEGANLKGMGTTMVLALLRGGSIYLANVGDSRAYLYRSGCLWQVSEDHSLINENVRSGRMTYEQAQKEVARNVITRSVGFERDVLPDILVREVESGDGILLCSDGLSGLLSDEEICSILNSTTDDKVVERCVEAALKAGGDDNVTVLYLKFG